MVIKRGNAHTIPPSLTGYSMEDRKENNSNTSFSDDYRSFLAKPLFTDMTAGFPLVPAVILSLKNNNNKMEEREYREKFVNNIYIQTQTITLYNYIIIIIIIKHIGVEEHE